MKTMREIINTTDPGPTLSERALYEADEHVWIAKQIAALRDGEIARVDRDNLVEYLTEMTIRDKRELKSRLVILVMHLLKVRLQPEKVTQSWVNTIMEQQDQIGDILKSIPSLRPQAAALMAEGYPRAVRRAASEMKLSPSTFPIECPWTVEEALAVEPPAAPLPRRRRQ